MFAKACINANFLTGNYAAADLMEHLRQLSRFFTLPGEHVRGGQGNDRELKSVTSRRDLPFNPTDKSRCVQFVFKCYKTELRDLLQ